MVIHSKPSTMQSNPRVTSSRQITSGGKQAVVSEAVFGPWDSICRINCNGWESQIPAEVLVYGASIIHQLETTSSSVIIITTLSRQ